MSSYPTTVPKDKSVHELYSEAVQEYHSACHSFQDARQRKETAEKRLHEISAKLTDAIQANLHDPTVPMELPTQRNPLVKY